MTKKYLWKKDWLGRQFAINIDTNTILLFEPGTGEVLDILGDFYNFHNVEITGEKILN